MMNDMRRRGVVAQWLERKTLIHEVEGLSPVSGVSAPQIRGLDDKRQRHTPGKKSSN